jgi:alpha-N-arabinofuranosidase
MARGKVLNLVVESPTYEVAGMGQVPYLDCVATSSDDGKTTLFILNRDLAKAQTVEVHWEDKAPGSVLTSTTLTGSDLKAFNTFDSPNRVVPQPFEKPVTANGRTRFEVPARSYSVMQWGA